MDVLSNQMPGATSSERKLDFFEVTAESIRVSAGSICNTCCRDCNAEEEENNKNSNRYMKYISYQYDMS